MEGGRCGRKGMRERMEGANRKQRMKEGRERVEKDMMIEGERKMEKL